MTAAKQYDLPALDAFMTRMPALPIRSDDSQDEVLARGTEDELLEYLKSAYQDPAFAAAVAHAAPALWNSVEGALSQQDVPKLTKLRKAAISTAKFLIRASTRPTPFGMLAAVAPGTFTEDPLPPRFIPSAERLVAQPDMRWLMPVIRTLESDIDVLKSLRVYKYPCLRDKTDHMVVYRANNTREEMARVAVKRTPVVGYILNRIGTNGEDVDVLGAAVKDNFGHREANTIRLISKLVEAGVIYTDLRPYLDGSDPLTEIIHKVSCKPELESKLHTVLQELDRLSSDGEPGITPSRLRQVHGVMSSIKTSRQYLHISRTNGVHLELPQSVRVDLQGAMSALQRLSSDRLGMRSIREYHLAFLERYGIDRVVPLQELIDPDKGLGAPSEYSWPQQDAGPQATYNDAINTRRESKLSTLYVQALRGGRREISLSDDDIDELRYLDYSPSDMQTSAELYFSIAARSWEDLRQGKYRVVLSANPGSHSAHSTSARFWSALPELTNSHSLNPIDTEAEYSAVIGYIPRSDAAANLLNVDDLGEPTINGGVPQKPGRKYVSLERVGIRATIRGLFPVDLSDGRAIRIRSHDTVYVPAQAPNELRLLAETALEFQRLWEPWSWGNLRHAPYTPRVSYGRTVLAPATWHVHEARQQIEAATNRPAALRSWATEWNVPRYVMAASRDMHLVLDLQNDGHTLILCHELQKGDRTLVLYELPGGADAPWEAWGWLRNGDAMYASEFIASFENKRQFAPERIHTDAARTTPISLRYLPGSAWKSLRVYLPSDEMNAVLTNELSGFFHAPKDNCTREHCAFFVKYKDARGPHLRIRHRNACLQNDRLTAVLQDLAKSGKINTFIVDEYVPEVERYGGPAQLECTHCAFAEDSLSAITALSRPDNAPYSSLEEYTLMSWVEMLVEFGSGYASETSPLRSGDGGFDQALAYIIFWTERMSIVRANDKLYSRNRRRWSECLKARLHNQDTTKDWGPVGLGRNQLHNIGKLCASADTDKLRYATPQRVLGSHMHMSFNRIFGANPDKERLLLSVLRSASMRLAVEHERGY